MAAALGAVRWRSKRGRVLGSRSSPRLTASTISLPQRERSKPFGQRAQMAEPFDRSRRLRRDVGDHVVLEHARARHVAGLRLALAPGGDLHQHRQVLRLAGAALQPLPGARGVHAVGLGRGQHLHLGGDPVGAPALVQVLVELEVDLAQMGHVRKRIGDLRVAQGPPGPVGEAVRLVEGIAGDAVDQLIVGDRVAVAEHHGGNLGIEDRMGDLFRQVPDDFDVLARGVEDLHHAFRGHQVEKGRKVDALGQRVDHHRLVVGSDLRDAEQGIIGGFAQKLGVDGDEPMARHAGADVAEFFGGGDQVHGR